MIRRYLDLAPRIDPSAWIASSAHVIGDVEIGAGSSIWYGTVVRGDVFPIRIGARTNVQDHCVLHVTHERYATVLHDDITIGQIAAGLSAVRRMTMVSAGPLAKISRV